MKEIFVWLHKDWHRSMTYKQKTIDGDETVMYYTPKEVTDSEYHELVTCELERFKALVAKII